MKNIINIYSLQLFSFCFLFSLVGVNESLANNLGNPQIVIDSIKPKKKNSKTLAVRMWDMVNGTVGKKGTKARYSYEDEAYPIEVLDDISNGYLSVSAKEPICGCLFTAEVAAYRDAKKNYTLLARKTEGCSQLEWLESERPLSEILPHDLNIKTFIPDFKGYPEGKIVCYASFEIPQYGTDTKVSLKMLPFGSTFDSDKPLNYGYGPLFRDKSKFLNEYNEAQSCEYIQRIVTEYKIDDIILKIAEGNTNFTAKEKELISESLGSTPLEDFSQDIQELKKLYDFYLTIKYDRIILGWDRKKARFYIKKKEKSKESFIEFLRNNSYFIILC